MTNSPANKMTRFLHLSFVLLLALMGQAAIANSIAENVDQRLEQAVATLKKQLALNQYYLSKGRPEEANFVIDLKGQELKEPSLTPALQTALNKKLLDQQRLSQLQVFVVISAPVLPKSNQSISEIIANQSAYTQELADNSLKGVKGLVINLDSYASIEPTSREPAVVWEPFIAFTGDAYQSNYENGFNELKASLAALDPSTVTTNDYINGITTSVCDILSGKNASALTQLVYQQVVIDFTAQLGELAEIQAITRDVAIKAGLEIKVVIENTAGRNQEFESYLSAGFSQKANAVLFRFQVNDNGDMKGFRMDRPTTFRGCFSEAFDKADQAVRLLISKAPSIKNDNKVIVYGLYKLFFALGDCMTSKDKAIADAATAGVQGTARHLHLMSYGIVNVLVLNFDVVTQLEDLNARLIEEFKQQIIDWPYTCIAGDCMVPFRNVEDTKQLIRRMLPPTERVTFDLAMETVEGLKQMGSLALDGDAYAQGQLAATVALLVVGVVDGVGVKIPPSLSRFSAANLKAVGRSIGRKGWTWTKETANEVRQLVARDNTGKVKARVRYEDHQYVYDEFIDDQPNLGTGKEPLASEGSSASEVFGRHVYEKIEQFEAKIRNEANEHVYILDEKGAVIGEEVGAPDKVVLEKYVRRVSDMILTHNHPTGKVFSEADFNFAMGNNLAEIRAVGPSKTYIMRRPKEGWSFDAKESIMKKVRQDWFNEFRREYSTAGVERKRQLESILWERGRMQILKEMKIEIIEVNR